MERSYWTWADLPKGALKGALEFEIHHLWRANEVNKSLQRLVVRISNALTDEAALTALAEWLEREVQR